MATIGPAHRTVAPHPTLRGATGQLELKALGLAGCQSQTGRYDLRGEARHGGSGRVSGFAAADVGDLAVENLGTQHVAGRHRRQVQVGGNNAANGCAVDTRLQTHRSHHPSGTHAA